jgi:hypothetical protein
MNERWASRLFEGLSARGEGRRLVFRVCAALVFACAVACEIPAQPAQSADQTAAAQPGASVASSGTSNATNGSSTTELILSGQAYCGFGETRMKVCHLGDHLYVGFKNLKAWMDNSANRVSEVALVLNGRVMRGITSSGPDSSYNYLEFDLKRLEDEQSESKENREEWNTLMSDVRADHRLHIRVAAAGNPPYWGPEATVPFKILPGVGRTAAVVALLLILLVGFLILARKSDILRDSPSVNAVKQTYSLARCQMAWWFFLVASSYCYIWLVLKNRDSLTPGVLILTGISAGTGLASAVIDGGKRQRRDQLEHERAALSERLAALPAAIAAAPPPAQLALLIAEQQEKAKRVAEVESELAALPSPVGRSEGFFLDTLRDETGISFHRFQMMAWTVILGFVFIASVWSDLTMPDFSPTLLGLMGISSGTYVGFKLANSAK